MSTRSPESSGDYPTVSPEFLKSYDHVSPSGTRHPACQRNRLAYLGIDARHTKSRIDLNLLTDRSYTHIWESSDDGWLIGGGDTTKLKRPDTAHAEIWRTGPDNYEEGGIPYSVIDEVMKNIQFGPLVMQPLRVNFTDTSELELLFKYEPDSTIGKLFGLMSHVLKCPCGDYGNPFHITLVRGVKFRSAASQQTYFEGVDAVVRRWQEQYPNGVTFGDGGLDLFANREEILTHYSPSLDNGVAAKLSVLESITMKRGGDN
jgi:hypothetical protein